ncbi:MAG: YihA family ribosome biogenesis GTP-binding protein [Clostridia bacterium]|nr:YihA family ribosome biogenesis GTP-binding protein [Clostridia bacterium]
MRFDNAEFEAAFGTGAQLKASDGPEIAFSGRSNVGKSSLLNKLLNRKALARVSSVPGKTVTVNFFRLPDCRFVDLPGYGYAKVARQEKDRWAELMEHYFSSGRSIRLVVQLLDFRHDMTALDRQMIDFLEAKNVPYLVALTKCDKLNKTERAKMHAAYQAEFAGLHAVSVIECSAATGEGMDAIRAEIARAVGDSEDK